MRILSMDELEKMFSGGSGKVSLGEIGVSDSVIQDIMMHEVADVVEKILLKHIQTDIYDAYSPHIYSWNTTPPGWYRLNDREIQYRRRNSLLSSAGIYKEMNGNELFMTSDVEANQAVIGVWSSHGHGSFLQMLEVGPGPVWKGAFGRPAISNAQEEIDSSSDIQKAFDAGLKRHGIKI